jgi:hypothetical protein
MKQIHALLLTMGFFGAAHLSAQVFMVDFGPTIASGADRTNSPYHAVNPAFTGNTWNSVVNGNDVAAGALLYADLSSASGVSINLGVERTLTPGAVDFSNVGGSQPGGWNTLGTAANTGVFSGNSVGKDALIAQSLPTTATHRAVGAQINGLAAGAYEVYVVGWNTNIMDDPHTLYVTTGTPNTILNYTFLLGQTVTNNFVDSWGGGSNYAVFTVNLNGGEALSVMSSSIDDVNLNSFLNMIQIVPVTIPEPKIVTLLFGAGLLLVVAQWRRVRI